MEAEVTLESAAALNVICNATQMKTHGVGEAAMKSVLKLAQQQLAGTHEKGWCRCYPI